MFVTLEDFFENYRIKNQQQPNETVLNRGLMRLKRETRELKSLVDILVGNDVVSWNANKIYEVDEYVTHNSLVYRSRVDRNFSNEPTPLDETNWELTIIDGGAASGGQAIKYKSFTATTGQTLFVTPFNIDSTPMVFIDGLLLEPTRYTVVNNTTVELVNPAVENESVTVAAGVTYDTSLVIAKQRFVATAGQYLFETQFVVKSPSVFVDGILLDEDAYSWATTSIELDDPLTAGQIVVIGNGSVLGSEIYTTADVDGLLSDKRNISDSYNKTEIDDKFIPYITSATVTTLLAAKANTATTLVGYGITDAYTKTQMNTSLALKVDNTTFQAITADATLLQKIKNVDGPESGLNADLLDDLDSTQLMRTDIIDGKIYDLAVTGAWDYNAAPIVKKTEIYLDVDSVDSPQVLLREFDEYGVQTVENTAYHTGNTQHMMVIKEGYFKGTWEPTLNTTFGISNYANYNWVVVVTPTLTGFEHDFNYDAASGHTPYSGFDNNITWDENQSEYHYGYVQGNTVKMMSIHRNGAATIDIPSRYQLIGIIKSFCTHEWVNKP